MNLSKYFDKEVIVINNKYKKIIILSIVFLTISIGMLYMVSFLGNFMNNINSLKKDFNDEYLFIHQPNSRMLEFFEDKQDDDMSFYAVSKAVINNCEYSVHKFFTKSDNLYVMGNRPLCFHIDGNIKEDLLYQNENIFSDISVNKIKTNYCPFEAPSKEEILFMKTQRDNIDKEDIYLIVLKNDSLLAKEYLSEFELDEIGLNFSSSYRALGGNVFNSFASSAMAIIYAIYFIYLTPAILYSLLIMYSYKIFLSAEMKYLRIRNIFYESKKRIFAKELGLGALLFSIIYFGSIGIMNISFGVKKETFNLLLYSFIVIIIVIAYSTLSIVRKATKRGNE